MFGKRGAVIMFRPFRALLFAGIAVLATTGSASSSPHADIVDAIAINAPAIDGTLSVMTYNIKGLPWPIALGRETALASIADRLASLRRNGRQPHIILLQEAFTPEAARIAARAGYAHVAAGPDASFRTSIAPDRDDIAYLADARWDRGEGVDKQLGSGLLILSDYPITRVDRMAFPDFACAGFDCLANKGILIAHLQVPGAGQVSVVNTHLNARKAAGVPIDRSQRAFSRQVELLAHFVAAHAPAEQAMILGGDMNIGKDARRASAFFPRFAQARLAFVNPHLGGARRALAQEACPDADTCHDLTVASEEAKDWLFARDARHAPMPITAAHVPFGTERTATPLSDHFGYVINYTSAAHPPVRFASADGAVR
jgi:endonuclease/exonuclease/phosphatase family metal-dependent hydrolase